MAFQRQSFNRGPRTMHDVSALNIKCCDCGAGISQLPFQPDENRLNDIRCRDCMMKRKNNFQKRF
jgi:CxxC-x17-CxxC domain-containing protein